MLQDVSVLLTTFENLLFTYEFSTAGPNIVYCLC